MNDGTVAQLELCARTRDGQPRTVRIRVGAPSREPTGEWSCAAEISGLFDSLAPMRGEDSLQALCLALGLCSTLLRGHLAAGGELHYPDGTAFPLEAYFGSPGLPSGAS